MTTHQQLYVSFWDVCLDNFPDGHFTKRTLGADKARAMVADARGTGSLTCVAADDLLAPYEQRSVRQHRALCKALAGDDFDLSFEDFIGPTCANVLQLARVGGSEGAALLVVSCAYALSRAGRSDVVEGSMFDMDIAPDSIEFHLFTGGCQIDDTTTDEDSIAQLESKLDSARARMLEQRVPAALMASAVAFLGAKPMPGAGSCGRRWV